MPIKKVFGNNCIDDGLPHEFTKVEQLNKHLIKSYKNSRGLSMPVKPIRNIPEFDPMQGVLIRYPLGISTAIIKEMAKDVIVYCLVSSSQQTSAYNSMNNAQVNMKNVEFILGATDSYWTRDYGPWWITDGDSNLGIVDFTYNRPRPNDNAAPYKVSQHLQVPYFSANFIITGGNYMTDGYGISASAHISYTENSQCSTNDELSIPLDPCKYVDNIMENYYGIHTYHVVADPNDEYIDHIDCWGKFLSPTKLLIREVPISHPQYTFIENIVAYFKTILTVDGNLWEIIRVYTPNDEPYSNSLILNNKVLVPIMNNGSLDNNALTVYQKAFPDHEIIGFTGSWKPTDALHCRIKGIPQLKNVLIGDINQDGQVSGADVVHFASYIAGLSNFPLPNPKSIANVNQDGKISGADVVCLASHIADPINFKFPCI